MDVHQVGEAWVVGGRGDVVARRVWRARGVPQLYEADIAAIAAALLRHSSESRIERLERRQATAQGRSWTPIVVEELDHAGRVPGGSGEQVVGVPGGALRLRTFGWAAVFEVRPSGCLLTVDDEAALGRRTLAAVAAVVRRRQNPMLGLLASEWGVPAVVLLLPIAASTVETATGRTGIAWLGVCLAALVLGGWLWWLHRSWLRRPVVLVSEVATTALPGPINPRAAVAALLLALFGVGLE